MSTEIKQYHQQLTSEEAAICEQLFDCISKEIPTAVAKVWHGHPVWFINDNPIVGYSKLKKGLQLLFWSGQSFDEPELKAEGKFKAANRYYNDVKEINKKDLKRWLKKAIEIQWDYKNIVKRKGVLERIAG